MQLILFRSNIKFPRLKFLRFLCFFIFIVNCNISNEKENHPPLPTSLEQTQDLVNHNLQTLQNSGINSIAYMVYYGNGEIQSGLIGDTSKDMAQRFKIGSITKLFTGIAILQLVDAGKLKLDDPVSRFIPEIKLVKSKEAGYREISIRDLLTHQSGLPSDLGSGFFLNPEAKDSEILTSFHGLPSLLSKLERNQPGKIHSYSNLSFALLGIAIERISGLEIEEYFQKKIFQKAGMKHSTLLEFNEGSQLISSYQGLFWKTKQHRPVIRDLTAGSLSTTGEDMGLFMKSFFQSKRGDGLLSKSSFNEFHKFQELPKLNFDMKMGLPVIYYERIMNGKSVWVAGHSGSLPPFISDLVYDPISETASFISGNTLTISTGKIMQTNKEIWEIVFEQAKGGKLESPTLISRPTQNSLDGFEGLYASPMGVHEVKKGNPSKIELYGMNFDLLEKDNRFGLSLRILFGLIPIKDKSLDQMRIEFEDFGKEKIATFYTEDIQKGNLGVAFLFEPNQKLPDPKYLTTYRSLDKFAIMPKIQLSQDRRGFVLATIYYSLGGMESSVGLPCSMESDSRLRILGYGRNLGEALTFGTKNGKSILVYSGEEYVED